MNVVHISTEFYPIAKAGGMADVVGALPIYQQKIGLSPNVIIPRYRLPWFEDQKYLVTDSDSILVGEHDYKYKILECDSDEGIPLIIIDIPVLFDRPSIYLADDGDGFDDEAERNICFQKIALIYLLKHHDQIDIIHCHDHQAGLIPFYIKYDEQYKILKSKTLFFTIHNGQYQGRFDWNKKALLEPYPEMHTGVLDWDGMINSMATAVKCSDVVNTVSPTYLEEIKVGLGSIFYLFEGNKDKCHGILNGIDHEAWHPRSDKYLPQKLTNSWKKFKTKNRTALLGKKNLENLPLVSFIGRFAHQKGADQLFLAIEDYLQTESNIQFLVLGNGDKTLEAKLLRLTADYPNHVIGYIEYNEQRAHQIYAASDFMIMPSRFEPCGLNQMFAMRYGTIPVVRNTGGLKDTVIDINENKGYGICFDEVSREDIQQSFGRITELFADKALMKNTISRITKLDFSWTKSAKEYHKLYQNNQNIKRDAK